MYGLQSQDREGTTPARKATRIVTNVIGAEKFLSVKCDHSHRHVELVNNRAKGAEQYPKKLCAAICRGIVKQKRNDEMHIKPIARIQMGKLLRLSPKLPDPEQFHDKEEEKLVNNQHGMI